MYTGSKPLPTKLSGTGSGTEDMAIQPIGINHKAANLDILSYQIDLHTIYIQLSKHHGECKMGKCGCGPFKIHKKKVFALLRVITKVFLLCDTNASKMGRNFVSSAERKSCKCQLNRVSPVPQKKKNRKAIHNISHCFGNWHTRYVLVSSSDC